MATEDKVLALKIRRTLARKEVDMALMDINCLSGIVNLSGTLRAMRGFHGRLDLDEELGSIMDLIRRIPGVKDVTSIVRVEGGGLTKARSQRGG